MIVTLKPCPQNFKACLFKKGGMGVGDWRLDRAANGVSRNKSPGASYPQVIHNLMQSILDTISCVAAQ